MTSWVLRRWVRLALVIISATHVKSETLTPPYFNLAEGKNITASATCGVDTEGPELYCKLIGANSFNELNVNVIQGQYCDYCDPLNPAKTHPPEFAVDGIDTWWQSPPLSRGMKYNEINLTIDLGQEFHVAYVYIKMANSPRPGLWILEKSADYGRTFTPWQYFSDSPNDCEKFFGKESLLPITKDDSVICSTEYSKIVPLEGGEIPISLLNKRPSANHYFNSTVLQEWTRATNVRLRFLRTKNLLGHLMSVAKEDPTVTRRYFYSIKDISIGGRCMCNGHAQTCDILDPKDNRVLLCRCQHNTCGAKCDSCCSGFEQKAWRQSKHNDPFKCEPCNCFNHSNECYYDKEINKKRSSLDIFGKYEGGGVCQNCQHNTEGINCNKCKDKFFRPNNKHWNETDVCQHCNCDIIGTKDGICDKQTGQCICKKGFSGDRCDICSLGYYGYPDCKPCNCSKVGSHGTTCSATGKCSCLGNYAGRTCDQCSPGYFNFSECEGVSPIKRKKLSKEKVKKVKNIISTTFLKEQAQSSQEEGNYEHECEMIKQLKEKFAKTNKRSEKILVLSCLPQSWTRAKMQKEFGVSQYMARKVKKIVNEKGILVTPNPKPGKVLDENLAQKIVEFYQKDDISRIMPGKKDFVAIKKEGEKQHIQKRLVLANLSEVYALFKKEYPDEKIGFSKFCELRPKNCILAGRSGTHTVCVCTLHQNMKLMISGSKLNLFLDNNNKPLGRDYRDFLYKIICNPPAVDCFLNKCELCPGIGPLKGFLEEKFEEELIDSITYKKWVSVDRCTMETIVKNTDDFLEEFSDELLKLKSHAFIAFMQKEHYNDIKKHLKQGEILITCDFAENYSFVMQDEVQSYHWNNAQATIHPFVIYFKQEETLQNLNYVFISNCLKHNTVAFHLFLTHLIPDLKHKIPKLFKIFYFSDGSAAQYKNKKNFTNLALHKKDFGLEAEWHYFATSHGKSACDGLGGTVKRLAARASLQRPYEDQIMTPLQLFNWSQDNITGINFKYCNEDQYIAHENILSKRYSNIKTIKGTQKIHSITPILETCNCDTYGSNGISCNGEGICECLENFSGQQCNTCKDGFYNYPVCEDCNCHPAGVVTGFAGCGSVAPGELCQCKNRVEGRICNKCKPLYWNLSPHNHEGCQECNCNVDGVLGGIAICDSNAGQCICKPSVITRDCAMCIDGTYHLTEDNLFGCVDCECDVGGSINNRCDKTTGNCVCQPRVTGRTCKEPLQAHYFPTLYQYQYEVEDGYTPENNKVRYAHNDNIFANYSWKGYAVFSELQVKPLKILDLFLSRIF
ncbi:unnamed protein product [Brassicogethes aeneus]|uniref:Laminin EGF-like domain-containing protein n=1 Tax=Brassicogethes aeneus TaxID=1431903 RepID=A0A9P0FBI7_BRAAE|nr:unnamed protein product [Brassicogethes aeneus]